VAIASGTSSRDRLIGALPAGGGDVVRLKSVKVIREYLVVLPVVP